MSNDGSSIERYSTGNVEVIRAVGEVEVLSIDGFRDTIVSAVDTSGALVVDLRKVSYIDSAGLEQLAMALTRRREDNKPFAILVEEASQPYDVLHVVQFHTLTHVSSDPAEVGLEG